MSGGNEGYRGQAELDAFDARQAREAAAREAAALAAKSPSLDQLDALARAAVYKSFDWYSAEGVEAGIRHPADAAYIAAIPPALLRALIARVRVAEQRPDRGSENRPELPGSCEVLLSDWSQASNVGGRSDDAMVYLTNAHRDHLGMIPLGWFREHTTLDLYEKAIAENDAEDAAAPPSPESGA